MGTEQDDALTAPLRAGIAIFNAGFYHAAHDAWEARWLDLPNGTRDERFFHGLIQFTAAIHHAEQRNWTGATGLAESGAGYLTGLGETYRQVDIGSLRAWLTAFAADPAVIERRSLPDIQHGGQPLALRDLSYEAARIAAPVLADALSPFDAAVLDAAIQRGDASAGQPFRALVHDFVSASADRELVYERLTAVLDRRDQIDRDLEGLFDPPD